MRLQGASKSELNRLRKAATRVRRGTYTDNTADAWEIYRLRCLAVAEAVSGAVLTGPSAAVIWGLATVDGPPRHVYIRNVTPGRYGADVKVLRWGIAETATHGDTAVTSVAWAIVDCARVMPKRDALIAADCAPSPQMVRPR